MADQRAVELIKQYEREEADSYNFRNLYQKTADLMFPREDQITRVTEPGREKTDHLYDPTAVMASMEMASGLSQNLIPPGQRFFMIEAVDKEVNANDIVKRYLSYVTDVTHEQLFASNFLSQFNETLRSLVVFGASCLFS